MASREAAHQFVDELILAALPVGRVRPTVVDLGSGVGASLMHLAGRVDMRGEATPSVVGKPTGQVPWWPPPGWRERVRCQEGNFLAIRVNLTRQADLVFSIEAFVHSPDADRYLHQATRVLRPSGTLIVCHDFLTDAGLPGSARAAHWPERVPGRLPSGLVDHG
jgi:hypothetical protein